ncbi:adenosylcobinamide-GDP ribazoletransferase [Vacuolonema iberomarrocanum]|uniref:adenosylcobinamide-GDP ribazoletransferase n=1 Tax=Vacuolonema iberomarrocanum TaxID=3454632 RepID=UPI0019F108CC|nr:adenosylcobinamide-GDP ribazoletransferase [filamentous cyanobacterium LEGE 07170]
MNTLRRPLHWIRQGFAAVTFYTILPIPLSWTADFPLIARYAPLVGLLLAGLLALADLGLTALNMPLLPRSVGIVLLWVALTGGLHLDGAMDTADGLSATDPDRRLEVMSDSRSGAFGVMAAIALLLLKISALFTLKANLLWVLLLAAGWGRWGQQVAIAFYPYLKPTGNSAFHKQAIRSSWDIVPSLMLMLGMAVLPLAFDPTWGWLQVGLGMGGGAIACLTAIYFGQRLGGHTGDTYGAVVEWSEALILLSFTLF